MPNYPNGTKAGPLWRQHSASMCADCTCESCSDTSDVVTIGSRTNTTLVDAQPDMALIVLAQDLKDRIYAAAHEAGVEPAAWLEAVLENLEGRKA